MGDEIENHTQEQRREHRNQRKTRVLRSRRWFWRDKLLTVEVGIESRAAVERDRRVMHRVTDDAGQHPD